MGRRVLTVTELSAYIKGVFEDELILHNVQLVGEVEEFKQSGSNAFFTLRDEDSRISCIMFSVIQPIAVGTKVEILGAVSYYAKTNRISFIAKDITVSGQGAGHIAFLKLKDTLDKQGVFKDKKVMPLLVNRIALITSETGAVLQDVARVFRDLSITADVKVIPVRVQGAEAKADLVHALTLLNKHDIADVAVIMRGGGAAGDLEVFNTEEIARSVKACRVFTLSAVGHETDTTLCDLAADFRAGTPSIAANYIANHSKQVCNRVQLAADSLVLNLQRLYNNKYARVMMSALSIEKLGTSKFSGATQRLKFMAHKLGVHADKVIEKNATRITQNAHALGNMTDKKLADARVLLATSSIRLDALSPLKTLAKGYVKVEKDKKSITSIAELNVGDTLSLYYQEGNVAAKVETITPFVKQ